MDEASKRRMQLNCLYEMFRDKIEENVIYIVYTENEGKISTTIDQLMSIAACSLTGHYFENKCQNDVTLRDVKLKENSQNSTSSTARFRTHSPAPKTNNIPNCDNNNSRPKSSNGCSTFGEDVDEADAVDDLTLEEQITMLRKSIDDLLMEKKSSHDKASKYLSKKMFPVTSYYSEVAGQLRNMVEQKTKQLVDLLLQKSENANYIDLHGLNPIQARLVVSELLNIRQNKLMIDKQGEASVDIITGWGKHCVTNGQRIRPAIVSLLKEKGFEFSYINKGALRVTIRRC